MMFMDQLEQARGDQDKEGEILQAIHDHLGPHLEAHLHDHKALLVLPVDTVRALLLLACYMRSKVWQLRGLVESLQAPDTQEKNP